MQPNPIDTEVRLQSLPDKPPENLFQLLLQFLDKLGRFRQMILAALLICVALAFAWSQIPEQGKLSVINYLVEGPPRRANIYPSVEIERTTIDFDLQEWTPTPPQGDPGQFCKVTVDEHQVSRRLSNEADYLGRRVGTTGTEPNFTSLTHKVSYQKSDSGRVGGPRMTIYDVLLDISKEPVNIPFEAHLRTVRYGGFSDPTSEWAAHTIVQPTRTVTIKIRFPANKPARNFRFSVAGESDRSNYAPVEPPPDTYEIKDNTITWTVPNPKLSYTYRIDWDWGQD